MVSNISTQKLKKAQVETPSEVIDFFWQLLSKHRKSFGKILDMGAGDGRFAQGGTYDSYEGIEIDKRKYHNCKVPERATIKFGCVFKQAEKEYDACIGNPPYVKHNNIGSKWRERVIKYINSELEMLLSKRSNLYVYFISLGIIKTKSAGLIALIIPYEWVYRPSAKALRDYIDKQGWSVHVYRFKQSIFDEVDTTASITIIDKTVQFGKWYFYDIDKEFNVNPRRNMLGTNYTLLKYANRGDIWAMRGLSPGTNKVFTLSEEERMSYKLHLNDVSPCVTSLRSVPKNLCVLNNRSFKKHFIKSGKKCWLIRSDRRLSKRLHRYLEGISEEERDTSTCNNREIWYAYSCHPSPKILYSSGFTKFGPKFLINGIGAKAVGAVHGIHTNIMMGKVHLRNYLLKINFEKQVVPYSGMLKKIEVRQMNSILKKYIEDVKKKKETK